MGLNIQHTLPKEILAAGLGCAVVDALFNPLEVIKVRLQALGSTEFARARAVAGDLVRSEGLWGLWSAGLVPTLLRAVFYVGFRIGMYPTVKGIVLARTHRDHSQSEPFAVKLLAGSICGGIGATLFNPLDLIRLRMQANSRAYSGIFSAMRLIGSTEGLLGLWRGSKANVLRATMLSGTQLSIYDQTKAILRDKAVGWQEGPQLHMAASLLSGSLAQVVIMPVDALKTHTMLPQPHIHQQYQRNAGKAYVEGAAAEAPRPLSLTVAARRLYQSGGLWAFYRGLAPALLRQGPSMLLQVNFSVISLLLSLFNPPALFFPDASDRAAAPAPRTRLHVASTVW